MQKYRERYGVTIVKIERLYHPKAGRSWCQVTWQKDGIRYTAKTFPGDQVNTDIERWIGVHLPITVDIITNGRRQIINIKRSGS